MRTMDAIQDVSNSMTLSVAVVRLGHIRGLLRTLAYGTEGEDETDENG